MGGAPGGDVASALAVQEVMRSLHGGLPMKTALESANREILKKAQEVPSLEGMGTTLTALKVDPEVGTFEIGHVGDSRAYHLSQGDFRQVSRDHTLVQDMLDAGKLPPGSERGHPMSHILSRVLGTEDSVDVDLAEGHILDGDQFLLCSDGLEKVMDPSEVEAWLRLATAQGLEHVVGAMLDQGNERGAPDNITVAILSVTSAG
jgi:protein phosphatase